MAEHLNQSQPNPGLRADGTPCICHKNGAQSAAHLSEANEPRDVAGGLLCDAVVPVGLALVVDAAHAGEVVARPQLQGHLRDQLGAGLGGQARRARGEIGHACKYHVIRKIMTCATLADFSVVSV